MEPAVTVTYRPNAKRQWRIKRGHEVIRLTSEQMAMVRGCLRSSPRQPELWRRDESGHTHQLFKT